MRCNNPNFESEVNVMKGKIHSFQSLGTLDGPGVRFVVFLHGCHLHCGYCHNIDVCRGDYTEFSPQEMMERVLRYRDYFGETGGITVSGGEPLLQSEFVTELFRLCQQEHIHTALDTSGSIINDAAKQVLEYCDLVLLDLKMANDEDYRHYIGCPLSIPLAFLDLLEQKSIPCWIRHVVVGGLNDNEQNIKRLKSMLKGKKSVQKIELLPFQKLCASKYQALGLTFPFEQYKTPSQDCIARFYQILN